MNYGPYIGTIVIMAVVLFAWALGYLMGYNNAKDGK
jgi:hypothetical protein